MPLLVTTDRNINLIFSFNVMNIHDGKLKNTFLIELYRRCMIKIKILLLTIMINAFKTILLCNHSSNV